MVDGHQKQPLIMNKNMEKYLPTKKFQYVIGSFVILALVFFLSFKLFSSKNSFFSSKKDIKLQTKELTLNALIAKDSDGDGVADWEETLWGTDPKNKETFGIPDAEYTKNKRTELKTNETTNTNTDGTTETETEKFARQFFASYAAMKASGEISDNTINDFSNTLAEKVADPVIVDKYTEKDIKTMENDSKDDKKNYYILIGNMFETYKNKGLGSELIVAGSMISTGKTEDPEGQGALLEISNAYKEFAQKLSLVSVPKSLTVYHLKIINGSNNTGVAVSNMSKMLTDPIIGISGTSQYEKYNNNLITSVEELETFLSKDGII